MNYNETLEFIHGIKWFGSRLGLERVEYILKALGNPEKKLKFVHIAGTNGKGSTAACMAAVLKEAGYKTGLYTSPYIIRFNERMQINGEQIPDERLSEITGRVRPIAEAMTEDVPTEFEIITAVAMEYFAEEECDIVVLEVGLGGEFDATNVIEAPELAVITAIGLDHTKELGPTLADIARAKAGIIKDGCDVVVYGNEPEEAERVFEAVCRERNARLTVTDFSSVNVKKCDLDHIIFDYDGQEELLLPLIGSYQPKNAAVAITALKALRNKGWSITDENIRDGLRDVKWPGRFEVLLRKPVFVIDGAHNPHGIDAARDSIKAHFGDEKMIFLVGVMADKDVPSMMKVLAPMAREIVTVTPNNPRAMEAGELAARIREYGAEAEACETIQTGVDRVLELAGDEGTICALGSLYFSSDVRDAVKNAAERLKK